MIIYKSDGTPIIHLDVDDTSYAYREIMGDCKVYLEFALTQHVELPLGAYVDFQGERYMLMSVADVTIQHNRDYEYKVTFEGRQARFQKYRVHNPVDGRLVFEMVAKPQEHLAMIVANLTEREGVNSWAVGVCIDGPEKALAYNHTKLNDALTQLANAYDTEWEVSGNSINLNRVEYNTDAPLALGYGRNLGFKPGVGRSNYGETGQIERLNVQGGDRNISQAEYGNTTLLLPKGFAFKFDGEKFKYVLNGTTLTETGFDASKAVDMVTDANGYSVSLASAPAACNEESLDLTHIYPKRVGKVTAVRYLYNHQYLTYAELMALDNPPSGDDWLNVQVDIIDSEIPASLDYADCLLANDEPLTVIFQAGMLAGREFSATFRKAARTQADAESQADERPANRFELVRANFNGLELPNATYRPNADSRAETSDDYKDTYIVVNCYLPQSYICDKATFSGAEMEMLREAAKYLFKNKDIQLTFKGQLDDLYSKRNWLNVGGKLVVGGCVSFTHSQVQADPLVTRIVAMKQFINNPYAPELTLSNESVKGGLSSRLSELGGQQAHVLNQAYAVERYAKRSFRDAKETMAMLEEALLEGFTERISPIAVQTMQLLLGDESLQFRYVSSKTNPQPVAAGISFNPSTRKLVCNANIIQHMTLGIDSVKTSHAASEYKFWDISQFESPYLGDALADKKFYLYAKCNKAAQGETGYQMAEYVLSQTAIAMNSVTGYYHLLVGILNSEADDDRSFVTLFGFTEILPGRITTDKIVSSEGTTFWDLVQNILQLGEKFRYDPVNGLVLKDALVQTGSGENVVLGAWCGQYDNNRTYKLGDEVWWQAPDGTVSTYRYINAIPSSGHNPSDDNYWQFVAKGVKGDSPLSADITNEVDGVAVGSDGVLDVAVSMETGVMLYFGTEAETLTAITPSVPSAFSSKITLTPTLATGKIAVTIAANTDFSSVSKVDIPIVITSARGSRTVTYTIIPIKEGEDGAVFKLVPSVDVVKGTYNSSNVVSYSPTSVSCQRMARTGSGSLAASTLGTLKYSVDGGTTENTYSSAVQVSTAVGAGRIIFYWYINNVLVDRETVPIVSDGNKGTDGTDGTDGNDGNGIASITEVYARSLNGTTPPSSWQSTKPSPVAGYFIWTKTTITFTQSSTPFVTYSAVYCAQDGEDGDDGAKGDRGPASPYRGEYDANETYYATAKRCDVVYYPTTGRWYQALYNGTDRAFNNKLPTNTAYWSDFGANFSNVATGFLLAVRAVIENLVVRELETDASGNPRIVAAGNSLSMYDAGDNEKLRITGGELSTTRQSSTTDIPSSSSIGYGIASGQQYSPNFGSGISDEDHYTQITFSVYEGAILNLPQLTLNLEANLQGLTSGNQVQMYWEYGWMLDGEKITDVHKFLEMTSNAPNCYSQETIAASKWPLSAGTHTLAIWTRIEAYGDINCSYWSYYSSYNRKTVTITYADQKTEIASNGFQVRFGSDQMLKCVKSGNDISLIMQADTEGIEVSTNNGIRFRFGGTWYTASRQYNSTLGTYYLKLT